MRVSYCKNNHHWRGVVKDGDRAIWTCEHNHRNRNLDTRSYGFVSATHCAEIAMRQIERGESPTGKRGPSDSDI